MMVQTQQTLLVFREIQNNMVDQLDASREIFALVTFLNDVAAKAEKEQQQEIETAMRKLLDIGERLSKGVVRTGHALSELVEKGSS